MIDVQRSAWPADMKRAGDFLSVGNLDHAIEDTMDEVRRYARENPTAFGLWALGIGFILGWKLKPW